MTGQLPDGEKVSMSALVLPFADEATEEIGAWLYLFASPSSYKKLDWFATALMLDAHGNVVVDDGVWTPADVSAEELCCGLSESQSRKATLSGIGAFYSEAELLESYYWKNYDWLVSCAWSDAVRQEYSYKCLAENEDNPSKPYSWMEYEYERAQDFDGFLFNVAVKGDSKGAISLVEKSPAPWEMSWKEDGITYKEWNYWEDKNDNAITDPSQLSISFAKATGIFTGKANAYFDYYLPSCKQNSRTKEIEWSFAMKHVAATLPYSGVMIADGEGGYTGLGSAVYSYKYTYYDSSDRAKTDTKKVSLPVSLDRQEP